MKACLTLTALDVAEINGFCPRPAMRCWVGFRALDGSLHGSRRRTRELGNGEIWPGGAAWGDVPVRRACAAAAIFLQTAADSLQVMADSVNVFTTTYTLGVLDPGRDGAGVRPSG